MAFMTPNLAISLKYECHLFWWIAVIWSDIMALESFYVCRKLALLYTTIHMGCDRSIIKPRRNVSAIKADWGLPHPWDWFLNAHDSITALPSDYQSGWKVSGPRRIDQKWRCPPICRKYQRSLLGPKNFADPIIKAQRSQHEYILILNIFIE